MKRTAMFLVAAALGCGGDEGTGESAGTDAPQADAAQSPAEVASPPDVEPDTTTATPTACATIAAKCRSIQQGCTVVDDGTPKCSLCPQGEAPDGPEAACAPMEGTRHEHDFGDVTLEPGSEHNGWCQSWVLENPTELWVNAVEFVTGGGYHHSNWFFVPEPSKANYPPGLWKGCYNNGFHEIEAALEGGVLFAQSTQVSRDLQKFPKGVAVRIPPWSRIIGATHLLNYKATPLTTNLSMVIWTVPAEEVTVKLSPFRLSYLDLAIPGKSKADFSGDCDLAGTFEGVLGKPLDLRLYYALPHYHALGRSFSLRYLGGPKDGEVIFEQGAFNPDPFGHVFDPPIDVAQGTGVSFTCGYENPDDKTIGWGIGDQEMCVMLGFAASPMAFDASVTKTTETDTTGEIPESRGECGVVGFPFAQNKAGGTPPAGR